MKIGFIADVHLGNHKQHGGHVHASINQRCRNTLSVLGAAAAHPGIDLLVIAGDLFDDVKPLPQIVTAAKDELATRETHIMLGNHDNVSDQVSDHALGPMAGPLTAVFTGPMWCMVGDKHAVIYLPFRKEHPKHWYADELKRLALDARSEGYEPVAVVSHFGIYDERGAADAQWDVAASAMNVRDIFAACYAAGVPYALSGDWHERATWVVEYPDSAFSVQVIQIGALVPTGWDNPGQNGYGSLWILDTDACTIKLEELPGPRFINCTELLDVEREIKWAQESDNYLYVRAHGRIEDQIKAVSNLKSLQNRYSDELVAWEFRPDRKAAEEKARQAATTASAQATLGQALDRYVNTMSIPEGVSRVQVRERARRYLDAGR